MADNFHSNHAWNCGRLEPLQRKWMLFFLIKYQMENGVGFVITSGNLAGFTENNKTEVYQLLQHIKTDLCRLKLKNC